MDTHTMLHTQAVVTRGCVCGCVFVCWGGGSLCHWLTQWPEGSMMTQSVRLSRALRQKQRGLSATATAASDACVLERQRRDTLLHFLFTFFPPLHHDSEKERSPLQWGVLRHRATSYLPPRPADARGRRRGERRGGHSQHSKAPLNQQ